MPGVALFERLKSINRYIWWLSSATLGSGDAHTGVASYPSGSLYTHLGHHEQQPLALVSRSRPKVVSVLISVPCKYACCSILSGTSVFA